MDLETVEQFVSLLSEHRVSEIILERDGFRLVARRPLMLDLSARVPAPPGAGPEAAMDAPPAAPTEREAVPPAAPEPLLLTAGMVGLFRHAEPPLGYGAHVTAGQVVGSIEAMKVLNDARAGAAGQVVDVYVEEGAPVEYGQALFRLMPE